MARSHAGRRASRPEPGWQPPERLRTDEGDGLRVLFLEESGRRSKMFDFGELPVPPQIQEWLARVFTRATGPRSGAKKMTTADNYMNVLRQFATSLAESNPPPQRPAEISKAHMATFQLRHAQRREYLEPLRSLMRHDAELDGQARQAMLSWKLPAPASRDNGTYSDTEMQSILTVLRGDVRRARDRIRAARSLLSRHRAVELDGQDSVQRQAAEFLDMVDRTGELPRKPSGTVTQLVTDTGGARMLYNALCLTPIEATSFALLLVTMTGENFGTVKNWPAVHHRPDGGDDAIGIALLEQTKFRRGPDRQHMVRALEDLPPDMAAVLGDEADQDRRLFRSPLRVYLLLLELTQTSRQHGDHELALSYVATQGKAVQNRWRQGQGHSSVGRWAQRYGFATGDTPAPDGKPRIEVHRLRQTAIERRRKPVAHTPWTMNDQYLARSRQVQAESRTLVADVLADQVAQARSRCEIPVFTREFLARAEQAPEEAAAELGVDPAALKRLISGEQDTVVTACVDHTAGPYTPVGQPCRASFLACLNCKNSRALPHQLPIQITLHERLESLRPNMAPAEWDARYGTAWAQLGEILAAHTATDRDDARENITDRQRRLVDDLVNGRLELR